MLTFRPSAKTYRTTVLAGGAVAIPLAGIIFAALNEHGPMILIVIGATLAAAAIGIVLMFRNTRVTLDNSVFTYRSWLGRQRSFALSEVGQLVRLTALIIKNAGAIGRLVVLSKDGKRLLNLNGQMWDADTISALSQELMRTGAPREIITEPITPVELEARHPGSLSSFETHPTRWGLLIGLGLIVVVAVVVVIVVGF